MLTPQGHVEHAFTGADDGEAFTAHTEPGAGGGAGRVPRPDAVHDAGRGRRRQSTTSPWWGCPAGTTSSSPRAALEAYAGRAGPAAGIWAYEALRIARGEPRLGLDTDHRTIPNEVGWIGLRGAPRQGLLPRPGDRRPGAHPRPPAAPADAAPPRRHREPPARARRRGAPRGPSGRVRRAPPHATTSWARSRWRWLKRNVPVDATLVADGMPPPRRCWSTPRSGCTCGPMR